ncbi:hypothetical protein [Brevundimonas diminuta]|uniref:hypothetical protein n=1 Tax=Brevundimonas diminuta TaxID=293 RepID=UPI0025A507B6|nr:hypothetical protein [Brevundimonas diminuta]MDM8353967.1 hypothetical protein [Brevundimonas diminuta]
MCSLFKKPKVVSAPVAADAPILRNPYLDGLDAVVRARQGGVRSLTIRRATGTPATPGAPAVPPVPTLPTTPVTGGSGGGSGSGLSDLTTMRPTLAITNRTLSSKV